MDNRLRVYLDTSVPNFLFAQDSPEKMEITKDLFDNFLKTSIYRTYISPVVIAEIEETKEEEKKERLLAVLSEYPIELLDYLESEEKEIQQLAEKYIERKIIPEKKISDAFHIAICVIKGIDYLVSWNYKHLANINKENRIRIVNLELGYRHDLRIITPLELVDYGN
jgi:predicted nucleic acid-binding protein